MSIITNALKKAQEKRAAEQQTGTTDNQGQSVSDYGIDQEIISSSPSPERFLSYIIRYKFLIVILFLGVSLTFAAGILLLSARSTRTSGISGLAERNIPKTEEKISAKQERTQAAASSYEGTLPFLNGIMYTPSSPYAVIDDTMISEGETVNGFTVTKISPDKVELSRGNDTIELKLK